MANTQDQNPRWVVRLSPMPGSDLESLLQIPLGLDVWERKRDPDVLVVAANESQISELERRRLARVERLYTVEEFVSEFGSRTRNQHDAKDTEESNEEESKR
jgi:hypothetical protein